MQEDFTTPATKLLEKRKELYVSQRSIIIRKHKKHWKKRKVIFVPMKQNLNCKRMSWGRKTLKYKKVL